MDYPAESEGGSSLSAVAASNRQLYFELNLRNQTPTDAWSTELIASLQRPLSRSYSDLNAYMAGISKRLKSLVILKTPVLIGACGFNHDLLSMLTKRVKDKFKNNYRFYRKKNYYCIVRLDYSFRRFNTNVLAQRYCRAGNLFDWLLRGLRLEKIYSHQLCLIIQHVCLALKFLHQRKCYLRAVGFKNILFPTADPRSLKLSLDSSVSDELLRLCGASPVHVTFCPPEWIQPIIDLNAATNHKDGQCRSDDALAAMDAILVPTAATNMWSIGVVAHALLTGKLPFGCTRDRELTDQLAAVHQPPYPSMKRDLSIYPRRLRRKVDAFLHSDPKRRAKASSGAHSYWFEDNHIRYDENNASYRYEEGYFWIEKQFEQRIKALLDKLRDTPLCLL